jgi:hypothetical protein
MDYGLWVPVVAAALAAFLIQRHSRRVMDAIQEALDNFRGGPPTAMHPSPAGDDRLLRPASKARRAAPPTHSRGA